MEKSVICMEKSVICTDCGMWFILLDDCQQDFDGYIFGECPHCGCENHHIIKEKL